MKPKASLPKLIDSPAPELLQTVVALWDLPEMPEQIGKLITLRPDMDFWDICSVLSRKLNQTANIQSKAKYEKLLLAWLYDLVRLNIIRGRIFDLREVLRTGEADCLGYAKIFTVLGCSCGLDMGIVEVLIDNRGRILPHTATLVNLVDGRHQFVDFWYGSQDIHHRRWSLQVKRSDRWQIEDIDKQEIKKSQEITYLPIKAVNGITLYIEGNRSLKNGDYSAAIEQYSQALRLYPQNVRAYYNRAIAYEKLGEQKKADQDYQKALRGDTALKRTLATQPAEIVDLIDLDSKCVPEIDQQIYLLNTGFVTGKRVPAEEIARKLDLPAEEVESILEMIKGLLVS